jgi:phosphopantothenoylcysteine decarboxylase/phosphopantothenate--cysteine ligase
LIKQLELQINFNLFIIISKLFVIFSAFRKGIGEKTVVMLANKKIILGVTGSIAAYKALDLVRQLKDLSAEVEIAMTKSACRFVEPLSFATLSGHRVIVSLFDEHIDPVYHITLAHTSNLLVVAPATANMIGKFSAGIADDFISTFYLAFCGPILIAPAMNEKMWEHPAVQANISSLKNRGTMFVEPEVGALACGAKGRGRLAEVDRIVAKITDVLRPQGDLSGKKILISAGPTREPIDPIRYLSNRSSGKMGFALAGTAIRRGAEVTLVCGPNSLSTPDRVRRIDVETSSEMAQELQKEFSNHEVLIMAAAVSDFCISHPTDKKIKSPPLLQLKKTKDILAGLAREKQGKIVVGFAAETGDPVSYARKKLTQKNLDMIVANDVTEPGAGFDTDTNVVTILSKDGSPQHLPKMSKEEVSDKIWDRVVSLSLL